MYSGAIITKIKYLFFAAIGLLSPIKYLLFLVGFSIIIDTITGVVAAKKKGLKIKSNRFASVLSKMLVYQLVVIIAFAMDKLLLGEIVAMFFSIPLLITKTAALMVLINEGYSIDENIRVMNNNKATWYYFKRTIGLARVIKKEVKSIDIEE